MKWLLVAVFMLMLPLRKQGDLDECMLGAWNRFIRSCRSQSEGEKVDATNAHRFLGVIEGRSRAEIPPVWESAVVHAHVNNARQLYYSTNDAFTRLFLVDDQTGLHYPRGAKVEVKGRYVKLVFAGCEFEMQLSHDAAETGISAIDAGEAGVYVAEFRTDGVKSPIVSHYTMKGTRVWSTSCNSDVGACIGPDFGDFHSVELALTKTDLCVFGVCYSEVYMCMLDRKSGNEAAGLFLCSNDLDRAATMQLEEELDGKTAEEKSDK